jgi:hypothetical protein
MKRFIRNPFEHLIKTLPIFWWPLLLFSFVMMYPVFEDCLERLLNLPMIYHRRLLSSLYAVVLITVFFPHTVYDLLMLGVDLVLFLCQWFFYLYLGVYKWITQFGIQIGGFGELQPKEIPIFPIYSIVRCNMSIFWDKVRIRIVVSIDPDTFVAFFRKLRPFLVWFKLLIQKFEPIAGYLNAILIPTFWRVCIYLWGGWKLFRKYIWPRDFRVLINRILFFQFLNQTLVPICRALWDMVKYWKREIIESRVLNRIWKKIREFLFW